MLITITALMPWHNITSRQAYGRAMLPAVAMVLTKEEDGAIIIPLLPMPFRRGLAAPSATLRGRPSPCGINLLTNG